MHCSDLAKFIEHGVKDGESHEEDDFIYAIELIDFLTTCRAEASGYYKTFLKLYDGAVQSSLLNFAPEKITEVSNNNFKIECAILDTNFILRLLDLQTEIEGIMAKETYLALKDSGTHFIVLEQTIKEAGASIRAFLNEIAPYSNHTAEFLRNQNIRISGLFDAYMRRKNRTELLELSRYTELKKVLENQWEIQIEEEANEELIAINNIKSLITYKDKYSYTEQQAKHDSLTNGLFKRNTTAS